MKWQGKQNAGRVPEEAHKHCREASQTLAGPPLNGSGNCFVESYSSGPVQPGPCRAGIFALITG